MAGHSKWAQIKRQKEKTDAQKSKEFGKLGAFIANEARKAKGDVSAPGLKAAIEKAKAANMPNDNIERAIKRASGDGAAALEPITYEAYGPGGCGIIIEALTANRNKAAQEVKFALSKHGFALAGVGSVTWAFSKVPGGGWTATTPAELSDTDLAALDALVTDLESSDEVQDVFTNAD